MVSWLSSEQNVIKLSVIRQYSGVCDDLFSVGKPSKKPIKLIVPFVYGVVCVEGLVSWLVTLHMLSEVAVEQIAEGIKIWMCECVTKEVASLKRQSLCVCLGKACCECCHEW